MTGELKSKDKTKYEINPDTLVLSEENSKTNFESEEELYSHVKRLIQSDELDVIKMGIHLLRTYHANRGCISPYLIIEYGFPSLLQSLAINLLSEHSIVVSLKYLIIFAISTKYSGSSPTGHPQQTVKVK